jgi:tRNA threonylcarbamoyladenosine biosynthesis protein TsaB
MGEQYSERPASHRGPLLVVDTGSPLVSVAVGDDDLAALRVVEPQHSSAFLLRWIAEALAEAGLELGDLQALVGLRGPGSFTGLRVGLATLLGLHQATGIPAGTVETFDVLASAATPEPASVRTLAVVDALRGEWFTRLYAGGGSGVAIEEPRLRRPAEIAALSPCLVIGFGSGPLVAAVARPGLRSLEPGPLAPLALGCCRRGRWAPDAASLAAPTYLRPALS